MKKVRSCWCEFASNLGGRYVLHLVDPNISTPSKCGILVKRPKLEVYLATTTTIMILESTIMQLCNIENMILEYTLF